MEQKQATTGIENLFEFTSIDFPRPLHHTKVEDMLVYLATSFKTGYNLQKNDMVNQYPVEGGMLRRLTADKYVANFLGHNEESKITWGISPFCFERDIGNCPLDCFQRIRFSYPHIESVSEMRKEEQESIKLIRKTIDTYFDQAD